MKSIFLVSLLSLVGPLSHASMVLVPSDKLGAYKALLQKAATEMQTFKNSCVDLQNQSLESHNVEGYAYGLSADILRHATRIHVEETNGQPAVQAVYENHTDPKLMNIRMVLSITTDPSFKKILQFTASREDKVPVEYGNLKNPDQRLEFAVKGHFKCTIDSNLASDPK